MVVLHVFPQIYDVIHPANYFPIRALYQSLLGGLNPPNAHDEDVLFFTETTVVNGTEDPECIPV